jgi:hypothetical protein
MASGKFEPSLAVFFQSTTSHCFSQLAPLSSHGINLLSSWQWTPHDEEFGASFGRLLHELESELEVSHPALPLATVEPPFIVLLRDDTIIGRIEAPTCPPASSLSVVCLQKRVHPGRAVACLIIPAAGSLCDGMAAEVLDVVASLVYVNATVIASAASQDAATTALQLPVEFDVLLKPSKPDGGVLVYIRVPVSTPKGSYVALHRVCVSGCDVALGAVPVPIMVGLNHDPAPCGRAWHAARSGDAFLLRDALDNGTSIEEVKEEDVREVRYQ